MSRSVTVPMIRLPWTIGANPTSSSFIIFAACATGLSASMLHGFEVIASRIFLPMCNPLAFEFRRRATREAETETEWPSVRLRVVLGVRVFLLLRVWRRAFRQLFAPVVTTRHRSILTFHEGHSPRLL